jgi:hypothetical protein
MAIVNGSLELGYKNLAWFNANPTLVLKEGQIVYLQQTGTYKIGNGVLTLSALSFLGISSETQTLQNVTDLGSTTTNSITANGFIKSGGTASQFLKANGSVDSSTYATTTYVDNQDALKVDKVVGKGLSTNDYTTAEQTKLAGIATGAEVNVNADWNATSGDAQILNKPSITTPTLAEVLAEGNSTGDNIIISPNKKNVLSVTDVSSELNYNNNEGQVTIDINGTILYNDNLIQLNAPSVLKNGLEVATSDDIPKQVVPIGGTTGQILAKVDDTDYNLEWIENYANYTSVLKHTVNASVALTKGQAVYVSGASGTNMLVSKASNVSEATSSKTLGLIAQNLAINGQGFVVTEGLLSGLNTNSATIGDPVWLGVDGTLIYGLASKPYAPAHLVFIGIVTRVSATVGEIFVKVQNGFELREIHDVDLITTTPSNNEILTFESSTSLWKNKSVVSALGFTPYNATNPSGYITSSALSSYVPYTGATGNVDLGTYTIKVGSGTVTANSIQVGAANVGLFSASANRLDFVTNGVSRMSINSSGTVVMGTASTNIIGNSYLDFSTNTTGLKLSGTALNLAVAGSNLFNIFGLTTSSNTTSFSITKPNNTGQTATFSISGWNYNGGSREWLSGNVGTQNENVWGAVTYSFVGASTITNAYGNVFNAATAGTNCTITNNFAARFNAQLYLTQTVTTETVVQTKTVTIVINGTTYKLLAA